MRAVARVPPFDRRATFEDLLELPDNLVAEIVDGELHASPRPAPRRAVAKVAIGTLIATPFHFGRGGPGGWWILPEPEVHLAADVVVPDFGGWRRARMPSPPEAAFIELAPDWVCEILSPSTASLDRKRKLAVYARERVFHAFLVDPIDRTLEVLRLEAGRWVIASSHGGRESIRAEPFGEVALTLSDPWVD
jgi:Uma2 family endonuclease